MSLPVGLGTFLFVGSPQGGVVGFPHVLSQAFVAWWCVSRRGGGVVGVVPCVCFTHCDCCMVMNGRAWLNKAFMRAFQVAHNEEERDIAARSWWGNIISWKSD